MTEILSSDVLEKQFGPTKIEILYQNDESRIITTNIVETGQVLELSGVNFQAAGIDRYPDEHREVLAGQSMGKVFNSRGVPFHRIVKAAYQYELPDAIKQLFGSDQPATVMAVSIRVGPEELPYAEILETYSPAVSWPTFIGEPGEEELASFKLLADFLE